MFPTVSETHIKILLKKYYNREAVVISALQVEKHPITTPGPLAASPSVNRLHKGAVGVYSALQLAKGVSSSLHGSCHSPFTLTPQGSPLLLRPSSCASSYYGTVKSMDGQVARHQSPKMKLKYMKSVFPKAEETLILDILANKDNNVQLASEELISMGFNKKETIINQNKKEVETPLPVKKNVTIMKTTEERNKIKESFQKKYSSIAERVVSIALESVDYNEERAEQILDAVLQEDQAPKVSKPIDVKEIKRSDQTESKRPILKCSTNLESKYRSQYSVPSVGPNPSLRQGPKDNLLLEDYMAWNGPNPQLHLGQAVKPEGPELRKSSLTTVCGPSGSAKGPAGIAKGSMYKLNKKSAKIVV
ncbi:unnamed protein product [Leptosia nina]|uniref:CUE domain-containing protein n=1 Tax=Leptosia nina TaxID=320188 RepID=A0AAV1K0V2_9NEOP